VLACDEDNVRVIEYERERKQYFVVPIMRECMLDSSTYVKVCMKESVVLVW
jgi:hypothetical protein